MSGKLQKSGFFKRTIIASILMGHFVSPAFANNDRETPEGERPWATIEKHVLQSVAALIDNRPQLSLEHSRALLRQHTNFRLGHLLHADLLAAQAHQDTLVTFPGALEKTRIQGIINEARARVYYRDPPRSRLPDTIMHLSKLHRFALVLDASRSRLYVFKNSKNSPELLFDHYASTGNGGVGKTGEGDEKTPLGVYHLVSYLDGNRLPPLYGAGAYPINYPNRWDQLHYRYGYGIWLHGTPPAVYSRPPQDSRGCIVVSNPLIRNLAPYIDTGHTPIILAAEVKWLKSEVWQTRQGWLLRSLDQWQRDWESLDVEKYLTHYSRNYRTLEEDYEQMARNSRRNSKKKTFVEVRIENVDLFDYPGETDTVIAVFDQDYRSNNYSASYRKQQFWRYENDRWLIIFEDKAETSPALSGKRSDSFPPGTDIQP